ncbi:hypothetical protein Q4595_24125, partial [Wenyingzhuangia sp. 1_MG-2023]|nr:hypothetical protein [Wenyingzhuangia sp. 1_MG-2023]
MTLTIKVQSCPDSGIVYTEKLDSQSTEGHHHESWPHEVTETRLNAKVPLSTALAANGKIANATDI